ncbi:hypothetical protein ACFQ1M_10840 [Sungkyunkwania multivorans]|uniref:Uncharacterized protein n=1 Tax=Sungkyunkwania multivorans TaxID=1173618 RepID=A0ABW3CY24_9FLAO
MAMFKYSRAAEILWLLFVFLLTTIIVVWLGLSFDKKAGSQLFGLSIPVCVFVFFSLNTFVFFGVKEFFRKYTQRLPNVIIIVSGILVVCSLVYLNMI